jgi:hypothetical protein
MEWQRHSCGRDSDVLRENRVRDSVVASYISCSDELDPCAAISSHHRTDVRPEVIIILFYFFNNYKPIRVQMFYTRIRVFPWSVPAVCAPGRNRIATAFLAREKKRLRKRNPFNIRQSSLRTVYSYALRCMDIVTAVRSSWRRRAHRDANFPRTKPLSRSSFIKSRNFGLGTPKPRAGLRKTSGAVSVQPSWFFSVCGYISLRALLLCSIAFYFF